MTRSKPTKLDQAALLEELKALCSQGQAENEPEDEVAFLRNFLPIRSHYRVLDPDTQLVIGDKGAGKTQLFRALSYDKGRQELTQLAKQHSRVVVDLQQTAWAVGFASSGTEFPPGGAIRVFATAPGRVPADMQTFWLAVLARVLLKQPAPQLQLSEDNLASSLLAAWSDLAAVFAQFHQKQGILFAAIDELDARLRKTDSYLFITYDDLDRVSPGDWQALEVILQGLVQFWAAYGRRWRRVRPKLFLLATYMNERHCSGRTLRRLPPSCRIGLGRERILWRAAQTRAELAR